MEEWRDVIGFEAYYQISNYGNCRSKDRDVIYKNGQVHHLKGNTIKAVKCTNGYYEYQLNKDGKRYCYMAHRLVAEAFIPNPNNLPEVNHKDEVPSNNISTNLEWCTAKYNANYGTRNERCFENGTKKQQKKINQLSIEGKFIKQWDGIGVASRTLKINDSQIIRVCKHKSQNVTAGGFRWEYVC